MRWYFLASIFTVLILSTYSCNEGNVQPETLLNGSLSQSWTHSREEQADANSDVLIFRKSESKQFPASWFREEYEFKANGACRYRVLHPADAHFMAEGRYKMNAETDVLSIYDSDNSLVKEFKIQELSQDRLVMERLD